MRRRPIGALMFVLITTTGCIESSEETSVDRQVIRDARVEGVDICWMFSVTEGCDPCFEAELYDDGTCDAYCALPDPDCEASLRVVGDEAVLLCEGGDCGHECPDIDDSRVHYFEMSLEDPWLCRSFFFTCGPRQTSFSNECGCGCIDVCDEGLQLCEGCPGSLPFCADADSECPEPQCSPPNPDCLETGCPEGQECALCSGEHVCLREGDEC